MTDFHPAYHQACREANERIAALEADLAAEREHPTNILQCAACQRIAVVQNAELTERAERAEAELAAAVGEVQAIDATLARRPALADISDRLAQIERACSMAGRAEQAEAEATDAID